MTVPAALEHHYRELLGLVRPWKITDIVLDVIAQRVDITLEWPAVRKVPCPECGRKCGRKERFITVLVDINGERVLEVAPSKSSTAAKTTLAVIPEEERPYVKAVAMDMSAAMEKACREELPNADIVYDKFHIEQHLSLAMGKVRASEHRILLAQGIPVFKRTRYLFLRRKERGSKKQRAQYRDIKREFGQTRFAQSRIGRMWAIKEAFRTFWNYVSPTWALKYFQRWYFWATHSRIEPAIKVARMINSHLDNILTYFSHGITNAYTENINGRIQEMKAAAKGFRNFNNYRNAILFYCGKLDMRLNIDEHFYAKLSHKKV